MGARRAGQNIGDASKPSFVLGGNIRWIILLLVRRRRRMVLVVFLGPMNLVLASLIQSSWSSSFLKWLLLVPLWSFVFGKRPYFLSD
jgi:hypothetical protein